MERLTDKDAYYEMEFCEHCPYNGEPNGCNRADGECEGYFKFTGFADRLTKLEDKLESGLLLDLPCKVGDTVYRKWSGGKNKTSLAEFYVTHIEITRAGICFYCLAKNNACIERKFFMKDYGEVWFATKEQAEVRLKELQGN